jgi:hypothetical protein
MPELPVLALVILGLLIGAWWVLSTLSSNDDTPAEDEPPPTTAPPDGTVSTCRKGGGCGSRLRNVRLQILQR